MRHLVLCLNCGQYQTFIVNAPSSANDQVVKQKLLDLIPFASHILVVQHDIGEGHVLLLEGLPSPTAEIF